MTAEYGDHPAGSWIHGPMPLAGRVVRAIDGLAGGGWRSPHRHVCTLFPPAALADVVRATPEPRRTAIVEASVRARLAVADTAPGRRPDFDGQPLADASAIPPGVLLDAAVIRLAHDAAGLELSDEGLAAMLVMLEAIPGRWYLPSWLDEGAGDDSHPFSALELVLLLTPRIRAATLVRITSILPAAVKHAASTAMERMCRRSDRVVMLLHALCVCRITTVLPSTGESAFATLKSLVRASVDRTLAPEHHFTHHTTLGPSALVAIADVQPAVGVDLARHVMRRLAAFRRLAPLAPCVLIQGDLQRKFVTRFGRVRRLAAAATWVCRRHDADRGRLELSSLAVEGMTPDVRRASLRRLAADPGVGATRVIILAARQLGDEASVARPALSLLRRLAGDGEARGMVATQVRRMAPPVAEACVAWLASSEDRRELAGILGSLLLREERALVLQFLLAADQAERGRKPRDPAKTIRHAASILREHDRLRRCRRRPWAEQPVAQPLLPSAVASRPLIRAAATWMLLGSRPNQRRAGSRGPVESPLDAVKGPMLVLLLDLLADDPDAAALRRFLVRAAVEKGKVRGPCGMRLLLESSVPGDSPEAAEHDAAWRALLNGDSLQNRRCLVRRVIRAAAPSAAAPLVVLGEAIGVTVDALRAHRSGDPVLGPEEAFGIICERDTLRKVRLTDPERAVPIIVPPPAAVADLKDLLGPEFGHVDWARRPDEEPELVFNYLCRLLIGAFGWITATGMRLLGDEEPAVVRLRGAEQVGLAYRHPDRNRPVVAVTGNPILERGIEGVAPVLGVGLHEIGHHLFDFRDPASPAVIERVSEDPMTRALMNLLLDERLERRLRSMDERCGRLLDRAVAHFIGRRRVGVPALVLARAERRRVSDVAGDAAAGRYGGRFVPAIAGRDGSAADRLVLSVTELMAIPGLMSPMEEVLHGLRGGVPLEQLSSRRAAKAVAMAREVDLRSMSLLELESLCHRMARILGRERGMRRRVAVPRWLEERLRRAAEGVGGAMPEIDPDLMPASGGSQADAAASSAADRVIASVRGPGSGPAAAGTFDHSWSGCERPEQRFKPLEATERLPFDPDRHAVLAEAVRLPAASLRAALSRCGVVEVAVGGRRSGRPDRVRLRRWMQQPTASVCTGRIRRVEPSLALGVLIDRSGSMTTRIEVAKRFAAVVSEASRGVRGIAGFVAAFDHRTFFDLGDLRGDVAIASLTADGGNNDAGGLTRTAERLRMVPGSRRVIVLVSDGEPSECTVAAFHHAADRIERDGIRIVHVAIAALRSDVVLPRHVDLSREGSVDRAVERFSGLIEGLATGRVRRAVGGGS